uniref:Protein kinase domain-containing protein n=1 Tax=Hippocampus comes TaxID=109280 RepID=A0A3Q2Z4L4_HIPCM
IQNLEDQAQTPTSIVAPMVRATVGQLPSIPSPKTRPGAVPPLVLPAFVKDVLPPPPASPNQKSGFWSSMPGSPASRPGSGRFSVVKRCDHRATKRPVAVKQVNKKLMRRDLVTQEVNLLHRLQHPNIVNLVDTYETPSRLLDYIVSWGNLTEEKVACYLRDLLDALHYLHNSRIAHLDVKPENLLVVHGPSGQPLVKLTDLGDAVQLGGAPYVHPLLGSPEFASPELVLGEPVSLTSDVWSVGVVAYVMLSGASPFLDESAEETCLNICRQDFSFPKDYFRGISREACDFVRLLLRSEPAGRPPSGLCLQEAWLRAASDDHLPPTVFVIPTTRWRQRGARGRWSVV